MQNFLLDLKRVSTEKFQIYFQVMLVSGDPRIGFFTKRTIEAGDEIFINYGYNEQNAEFFFE